jgi:Copper amine oxidase N-terminal domain
MSSPSRLLRLLIIPALVLAGLAPAAASAPSIVVDGSQLRTDVPALVENDRVLVPLRGVFEQLGAAVSYDAGSQTASASLGSRSVRVTVGASTAYVNGKPYDLDVGAREFAGRVMIPLRFVAQSLGASVDYDASSDTIAIVSGQQQGNFAAMTSGPPMAVASHMGQGPSIEDERPDSGTITGSEYPSIYARFDGGSSAVDPSTVRVTVDGADVTGSSTISSAYVDYTPTSPLLTGQHTVSITGAADDGAPLDTSWSFRVDAGTVSDYTSTNFANGFDPYGYGYGYGYGGFGGAGWPVHGYGQFGWYPPGFSLFTPGSLFYVSGGTIGVVFVSLFLPSGHGVFTISGLPGTYPLNPWLGNPGWYWGTAQVPLGVTAHNATLAARFESAGGHKFVVHSSAPIEIMGMRKSLPANLRYAVMPHLVNHPTSLRNAVVFERLLPAHAVALHPVDGGARTGGWHNGSVAPVVAHAPPTVTHGSPGSGAHPEPVVRPEPGMRFAPAPIRPAEHPIAHPIGPVMHPLGPMPQPGEPIERFPMTQWQFQAPVHAPASGVSASPK